MSITFLKPKDMKRTQRPILKVFPDGREVLDLSTKGGREEYRNRTMMMRFRQVDKCCLCWNFLPEEYATFEHEDGRGFNGSHRDDRIYRDGKKYNGAAHSHCNLVKGSMRMAQFVAQEKA